MEKILNEIRKEIKWLQFFRWIYTGLMLIILIALIILLMNN